ncbi:MAG: hypothetical protein QNK89_11580 [Lacinutrix sp.]
MQKSKWFTPSTVGNVLLANTHDFSFEVSDKALISEFTGSQKSENLKCFLDRLRGYKPNPVGTIIPKKVEGLDKKAQWISVIAAGAWYKIYEIQTVNQYRYKRISPYGNIDCDAIYISRL